MKRQSLPIVALLFAVGLLTTALIVAAPAFAETELTIVMHSDLKLLDPIWSGGYITRNHGYMIYDTLFATDAAGQIRPQMVERYDVSADKLTYTLTLREGLLWHDGKPVAAEDCVASLKRWGSRDTMGQKLMTFVKDMPVIDTRTFRIVLKEPTGLVLPALGKLPLEKLTPMHVQEFINRKSSAEGLAGLRRSRRRRPSPIPAHSCSSVRIGSRATKLSTRGSRSTGRAPSRPPVWPVARWRR